MKKIVSILVVASGLLAHTAHAEIVSFEFTGVISRISAQYEGRITDKTSALVEDGSFALGQAFTGLLSYSTNAPPYPLSSSNSWYSSSYAAPGDFVLSFPSSKVSLSNDKQPYFINVSNGSGSWSDDALNVVALGAKNFGLRLADNTNSVFTDANLPTTLALSSFSYAQAYLASRGVDGSPYTYTISGEITSLTKISPVPEPGMAWLMLGGLAALGARRFLRKT
ncbi:PEP-CTERM sorting domain-containing protein [Massilia genomosp. 1]|nr:PEP-CTERM sorting domain-containing protein [Massilia genomosp. 1]